MTGLVHDDDRIYKLKPFRTIKGITGLVRIEEATIDFGALCKRWSINNDGLIRRIIESVDDDEICNLKPFKIIDSQFFAPISISFDSIVCALESSLIGEVVFKLSHVEKFEQKCRLKKDNI